ncbi:MAG TPA: hydrogenase nickel incorporation protein HypB [Myxococcota bacterium]|nr:hydrogenase nickel incorporation protein HypB [Myxococcota bacterium]HQK50589.1 hydrogenase nickel incorporation protein HypB [Myxococcota bacterium]
MTEVIRIQEGVLADNDRAAEDLRLRFRESGTCVVNLMSGPGAGKTTLLERTAEALQGRLRLGVAVGDIQTSRDADRIARHGVPVVQINTGDACHLDARMVTPAADHLLPLGLDLLIVENVGNLVCPAEFEIGEDAKVVMLSVTEGADKPAKYPLMFHVSRLMLVSKVDLLPHVDFSMEAAIADARALNPDLQVIALSARTGEGLDPWIDWLLGLRDKARGR